MFGRIGSAAFLHLAAAEAQRRRLAQIESGGAGDIAIFARLLLVIAIALAGAGLLFAVRP